VAFVTENAEFLSGLAGVSGAALMLIVPLWSWSGRFLKRAAQRRGTTEATEEARIQLREAAEGDERKWLRLERRFNYLGAFCLLISFALLMIGGLGGPAESG